MLIQVIETHSHKCEVIMQEHEVIFEAYLAKKGLKLTQPRRLILNTVFDIHEHFDIERLYDIIHKISSDVSRATVYRLIPLLVEAGLIQKSVRSDSRDKYEHILGHPKHAHWICRKCSSLQETDMQKVLDDLQKQANTMKFKLDEVSITLSGLCWKCNTSENESQ